MLCNGFAGGHGCIALYSSSFCESLCLSSIIFSQDCLLQCHDAHHANLFVLAILYPSAHETAFVHHKDGNISGLNKDITAQMLNLALSKSDFFKFTGDQ